MGLQVNSSKYSRFIPILPKLFQKIKEEGTFPNSLYEDSITLISKPDKDSRNEENYRPISLMYIHAKIINKILANNFKTILKVSFIIIEWDLF